MKKKTGKLVLISSRQRIVARQSTEALKEFRERKIRSVMFGEIAKIQQRLFHCDDMVSFEMCLEDLEAILVETRTEVEKLKRKYEK